LLLIKLMHARWVILLNSIKKEEWERKLFHPDSKRDFTLYQLLALYAWHGKHHLAHIKLAQQNH
nr:DinB family protein [Bacteroidia bacterium]